MKVSCCLSRLQEKNNLWNAFFIHQREKRKGISENENFVREKEGWMDGERESAYGGRDMLLSFIFKFLVKAANVVEILNCAVMEGKTV